MKFENTTTYPSMTEFDVKETSVNGELQANHERHDGLQIRLGDIDNGFPGVETFGCEYLVILG